MFPIAALAQVRITPLAPEPESEPAKPVKPAKQRADAVSGVSGVSGVSAVSGVSVKQPVLSVAPVEEPVAKEAKKHGLWLGDKMQQLSERLQNFADGLKSDGEMSHRKLGGHGY
jgi:hypothetical protein